MSELTEPQLGAIEELKQFAGCSSQVKLVDVVECSGFVEFKIDVDTTGFKRCPGGLVAKPLERVIIRMSKSYPTVPPVAGVDHLRWVGFPHVLQGTRLCIYLDPNTEWDATRGILGFLARLWEWFDEAIGGRFDAATALHHPVGGVLHRSEGAPMVVATLPIPTDLDSGGVVHRIGLQQRSDHRIDVAAWTPPFDAGLIPGLLVVLPEYLPMGGGSRLSDLVAIIRQQLDRKQRRTFETAVRRAVRSLDEGKHLHVVIAVPNPASGNGVGLHLIGWRLSDTEALSAFASARSANPPAQGSDEPLVEWTYVDDQRPEIAVRRDTERPVSVYNGSKIAVWGCGALGSWIAELLVRAGARHVTLRDPGFVTRGLLVRQNYVEEDVGRRKAEALAERLRSLSDTCEVASVACHAQDGLEEDAAYCDFIFDTSVNTSVNATLDEAQRNGILGVPVVQAATDNQTATLSIVTVTGCALGKTTSDLDQSLFSMATNDPRLTAFRTFWDHNSHPTLTPAPGCSVPTFHGSGADAMGIASVVVSTAAIALSREIAGGYLLSLSYSPFGAPPITCAQF